MVVDYFEQNQKVKGGSEVMSADDVERVRIAEEGIIAMNVFGDVERVRFVVEDDLESGETDDQNAKLTPLNNESFTLGEGKMGKFVDDCLHRLSNDEGNLAEFVEHIRTWKKKVDIDVPNPPSKKDDFEKFIGVSNQKSIEVKNP
ncbi:hypothetical protein CTI12_AA341400 [Artemisia annua]|uniref:Uncharacterized protein n=1 Tax=Artemisia annua TaxID=35608 RepID=A0A2U1MUB4_ARTAN|nr:hypothetical protein CTI12_AA341400 [Artemisia annua]